MRFLRTVAVISMLWYNTSAQCPCANEAAKAVQCSDSTDFACLCSSNYSFELDSCLVNTPSCSSKDRQNEFKNFYNGCSINTSTTTGQTSSTAQTTSLTSTSSSSNLHPSLNQFPQQNHLQELHLHPHALYHPHLIQTWYYVQQGH